MGGSRGRARYAFTAPPPSRSQPFAALPSPTLLRDNNRAVRAVPPLNKGAGRGRAARCRLDGGRVSGGAGKQGPRRWARGLPEEIWTALCPDTPPAEGPSRAGLGSGGPRWLNGLL